MSSPMPYGAWPSPLSAARVTAGARRFDHLVLDGGDLYWAEGRASEGGRTAIVRRRRDGDTRDVTPAAFNVRTRVHEYGGAAYTVADGVVFFSNFADQRLYRQRADAPPEPLTAPGYLYADAQADRPRRRLIAVREDRTHSPAEPVNAIVAVAIDDRLPRPDDVVLVSGADFYSDPVLSPDGSALAWLEWRHPNMPWDGTDLWVAAMEADGSLGSRVKVAGGASESIFQPQWSPEGTLFFVSDRTGFWNLYRRSGADVEAVWPMAAEFGKPQWTFSQVSYAFLSASRLVTTFAERGRWRMGLLDLEPRRWRRIEIPLQAIDGIQASDAGVFFIGGSPTESTCLVRLDVDTQQIEVLRESATTRVDPSWISVADAITYASDGRDVHGFFYAPKNPDVTGPADRRPPLLVLSHGGPTGATSDVLDEELQFWTSRGFAVLDVNYSGSTGYGRAYRERLNGQWGVVDVADCVNGARHLVAEGLVDAERLIIRGGSAGGYTTLAALTFHDTFKAGASYYGISDVEVLARDTHKFESRYLDTLIGPYPAMRDLYRQRSPIHAIGRLSAALILFQGLEDQVVPPNQSQMMADAVRRKGLPVAYVAFEGEQHGFRRAENIVRSLEAELFFYGAVFGFHPADPIDPIPIDNLPTGGRD